MDVDYAGCFDRSSAAGQRRRPDGPPTGLDLAFQALSANRAKCNAQLKDATGVFPSNDLVMRTTFRTQRRQGGRFANFGEHRRHFTRSALL